MIHSRAGQWTVALLVIAAFGGPGAVWADHKSRPAPEPDQQPKDTRVLVRVVARGAMVLGNEVGGARVTITEVANGRLLASGLQQGESGDQNLIMRTPRLRHEPIYSSGKAGFFEAVLSLKDPTLVEITAQGPLNHPEAMQRASTTVLLLPGHDLTTDGIVLELNGYIVQIEHPRPGEPLTANEDVQLRAAVRMLSGAPLRPHGDWDSRKVTMYGEVLIGNRLVERVQLFYSGKQSIFEGPFFVPPATEAPDGILVRVVAADGAGGNFGMGLAKYPVVPEKLKKKN